MHHQNTSCHWGKQGFWSHLYFFLYIESSCLCLQKLQFIQDEKNKEIEVLRQRVRDLEQQSLHGLMDSRLKRRKIWDLVWSDRWYVRAFIQLFDSCIYLKHISLRICSKYFSIKLCCVLHFNVGVYCLSTIINEHLWTYNCEDCDIWEVIQKGRIWQVTWTSRRLRLGCFCIGHL